jgi:hypothetical protein
MLSGSSKAALLSRGEKSSAQGRPVQPSRSSLLPEFLCQGPSLVPRKRFHTSKTGNIEFIPTVLCLEIANKLFFVVREDVVGSHYGSLGF